MQGHCDYKQANIKATLMLKASMLLKTTGW